MARQQPSRSEARQPDPFLSWSVGAITWVKAHPRYILYGLVGIAMVAGLIIAWASWQHQRRQRAAASLYEARTLIETAMQSPSESASQQAIEHLRTLVKEYSSTPSAAQASWQLGHLYFASRDYTAALSAYEQARHHYSGRYEISSVLVTLDVAYAQEATGACDQALANYEAVQQSSAGWLHGEAYLGMGRCYEQRGATEEAIDVYERALADGEVTGAARQTIGERLAQLQPEEQSPAAAASDDAPAAAQEPSPTSVPAAPPPDATSGAQEQEPSTRAPTTKP